MKKLISIDGHSLEFLLNQDGNCWYAPAIIDDIETEVKINFLFHEQPEVDWDHFKSFYEFVSKRGTLKELIADSLVPVTAVGKGFFRLCSEEGIKDWKMEFSGLYYKGKTYENNFDFGIYAYSLIFLFLVTKDGLTDGDCYAYYLVDVENLSIVGARRMD